MPRNGLKNIVDIIDEKVMSIIDLLKKRLESYQGSNEARKNNKKC
jgi:hypothetical protein